MTRYIEDIREQNPPPFDLAGLVLLGTGLTGLVFGLSALGQGSVPMWLAAATVVLGGLVLLALCAPRRPHAASAAQSQPDAHPDVPRQRHRRRAVPDRRRRTHVSAAAPFPGGLRPDGLCVGDAHLRRSDRRLPDEVQRAAPILNRFGFRTVLIANALISSTFVCGCGAVHARQRPMP